MKKIILLFLFSLSFIKGWTQCKKTIKDDMTNTERQVAPSEKIKFDGKALSTFATVYFLKYAKGQDTLYSLQLNIKGLNSFFIVGKGDYLILKLSNDSLINLTSLDIYSCETQKTATAYYEIRAIYLIDEDLIRLLTQTDLMKIRIYFGRNEYEDYVVKEKNRPALKSPSECILKQ